MGSSQHPAGNTFIKEKVAVVTGAGRGLGRAIALAMSNEGAQITIMSRTLSELEVAVAAQIEDRGGDCYTFQGDVSQEAHVSRMVEEILNRYSTIDILVNNAAILGPERFMEDTDSDAWKEAAMLLYLIVKNRSFVDGNKRITASLFLHFLNKNGILYRPEKEPLIDGNTLASITLMIAESNPVEMETVKRIVLSILNLNGP